MTDNKQEQSNNYQSDSVDMKVDEFASYVNNKSVLQGFPIPPLETLYGDLAGQFPAPTWDDILPQWMKYQPVFRFAIREDLEDTGDLFLPTRAEPFATGYDVRAAFPDRKDLVLKSGCYAKIPLGFRVFAPKGWWLELRPRSSTFAKKHLNCLYGVIDFSYEGQCFLCARLDSDRSGMCQDLVIPFGEPLGQLIPYRLQEMAVQKISNDEFKEMCEKRGAQRKDGGFGSTSEKAAK